MKSKINKIILLLACLIGPNSYAAGDASAALQVSQWITAEVGNAADIVEQVKQNTTAAAQLQQNIQTVEQGYQNLEKLSPGDLAGWNKYIDNLKSIMLSTNGLAHDMADLDTKFTENFPGYDDLVNKGKTGDMKAQASSFAESYKMLTDRNRGTALGTLRNLQKTSKYLSDDELTLDSLKMTSDNAKGNMQVMQSANRIAIHQTQTLKNLHSTMLSQQNLMAQQLATENQRVAMKQAKAKAMRDKTKRPLKDDEKVLKTW